MPSHWVIFTLIFIIASGLLLASLFLSWYPHSVIESMEAQLNQGGLTQSEIDNLQGSLLWWSVQGIFHYGTASSFMLASGILVLVYALVNYVLFTWRKSTKAKQIKAKRQETPQVKFEEKEPANVQYEKTRKKEDISFPIAGGLLTILASCIVLVFSVIRIFDGILSDGAFGILVSAFAFTGGIFLLNKNNFAFSIIALCFMAIKGTTFIFLIDGDFWGGVIGMETLLLTIISLIFTSMSHKEFS